MFICKARREGDEMNCTLCGYFWDVKDPEPPTCKTDEELMAELGKRRIAKLREELSHD